LAVPIKFQNVVTRQ